MIPALALWVALFGLWPIADPGHTITDGPAVWLDLVLHAVAVGYLAVTFRVVRRRG